MRPVYIVLIMVLFLAAPHGSAFAVPWFTDNFDNYEEGSLAGKPADQPVWTDASGSVRIQTEFEWNMGKSGEINYSYISVRGQSGSNTLEITRFYYAHQEFKILTGPQPGAQTVVLTNVTNRKWHHIRLVRYYAC